MRRILVLSSSLSSKKKLFKELMSAKLSKKEIELTTSGYFDIWVDLNKKSSAVVINGQNLGNYNLIYFRRVGINYSGLVSAITILANKRKVKVIDKSWSNIGPMGDKLTSLTKLYLAGIPIPRTIYFSNLNRMKQYDLLTEKLGTPFVAKDLQSQRGKGVFLIKDRSDFRKLKNLYPEIKTNQYMFQSFIKKEHEYRLLVLGGKVRVWEEKIALKKNEFRNNVALGAREVFFKLDKLPQNYAAIAIKAAAVLNMQIAGVDLMTESSTEQVYLLEVNRGPGFTYDDIISPELNELTEYMAYITSNKND